MSNPTSASSFHSTFPVSSSEWHIGVHFNSHNQQQIHHNTEQQASIKYRYSFLAVIPYYLSKQPQWRHFVGLNEVKQQVVKNSIIHTWRSPAFHPSFVSLKAVPPEPSKTTNVSSVWPVTAGHTYYRWKLRYLRLTMESNR